MKYTVPLGQRGQRHAGGWVHLPGLFPVRVQRGPAPDGIVRRHHQYVQVQQLCQDVPHQQYIAGSCGGTVVT